MVENNQFAFFVERYTLISQFTDKINRTSEGLFNYQTYKNKYSELISQKNNDYEEWENFLKKFIATTIKDACVHLTSYATTNKNLKEKFSKDRGLRKPMRISALSLE